MILASLIIDIITAIFTVIPILFAVYTYHKDVERKAQQDTIEAYQHLQTDVLSHISRLKPSEVESFANKRTSEEYKQFTEYLMAIECFCIGLEQRIYDFDVFYSLARDYFDDEKGPIRPTIKPILEVKNRGKHKYYQSLERVWTRMEERKHAEEMMKEKP